MSHLKIIRNCRVTRLNVRETGKKKKCLFYKIYQIGAKSEIHIERLRWKVDIPENCCGTHRFAISHAFAYTVNTPFSRRLTETFL